MPSRVLVVQRRLRKSCADSAVTLAVTLAVGAEVLRLPKRGAWRLRGLHERQQTLLSHLRSAWPICCLPVSHCVEQRGHWLLAERSGYRLREADGRGRRWLPLLKCRQ